MLSICRALLFLFQRIVEQHQQQLNFQHPPSLPHKRSPRKARVPGLRNVTWDSLELYCLFIMPQPFLFTLRAFSYFHPTKSEVNRAHLYSSFDNKPRTTRLHIPCALPTVTTLRSRVRTPVAPECVSILIRQRPFILSIRSAGNLYDDGRSESSI